MNNKLVVALFGAVLLVALGVVVVRNSNTPETVQPENLDAPSITDSANTGKYEPYTKAAFEANAARKRILFFHASWCPTCKIANEDILNNIDLIPEDVIIFKTDYDNEIELKKKYEITYQHTFVLVDAKGDIISKWNGGDLNSILREVESTR
jgi:thiol-disulfide isomerase/thioredoxin